MDHKRAIDEFFLMKIKAGVLVEKNGEVFNTITKHVYAKPTTSRPHQVCLYNRDFKNHVATTSVAKVLWMIRNKTIVPENTMIQRANDGSLKTFPYDISKHNHVRTGAPRKIGEEVSGKALKKFITNMPNITSIEKFCEDEKLNYNTFQRDLRLINDLNSVREETIHVVEGVMKYYKNVKSLKSTKIGFKGVHKLRLQYAKKPKRVAQFAKDENISVHEARSILNNKIHFIEGYIKEDEVLHAKDLFYEKLENDNRKISENVRKDYISNPRNVGVFANDMSIKYGITEHKVSTILNNKIHKDCILAKKCSKVKKKYYSTTRTYQSKK